MLLTRNEVPGASPAWSQAAFTWAGPRGQWAGNPVQEGLWMLGSIPQIPLTTQMLPATCYLTFLESRKPIDSNGCSFPLAPGHKHPERRRRSQQDPQVTAPTPAAARHMPVKP